VPGLVLVGLALAGCVSDDSEPEGSAGESGESGESGGSEVPEQEDPAYGVMPLVVERGTDINITGSVEAAACGFVQYWMGTDWETVSRFAGSRDVEERFGWMRDPTAFGEDEEFDCSGRIGPPLAPSAITVPYGLEAGVHRLCDDKLRCSNNFEVLKEITYSEPSEVNPVYQVVPLVAERGSNIDFTGIAATSGCGWLVRIWRGNGWQFVGAVFADESDGQLIRVFPPDQIPNFACGDEGPLPAPGVVMVPLDLKPGIHRICDTKGRCSNNFEII